MNNNTNNLDSFFSFVSKAVLIIPIVVVVFSLFFKFNSPKTGLVNQTPTKVQTPKLNVSTKNNSFKFNLNGSFICQYKNEDKEYYLSVKNKKINLKVTTVDKIKEYDLSSYAPMIETLFNLDINQLEGIAKPYLPKGINLETLLRSCK